MARKITAGIELDLKDQLSPKIKGAGISVQDFADDASGAAEKVSKTFSGTEGVRGAGDSVKGFAYDAARAAKNVNRAFSGADGIRGAGISLQSFAGNAVSAAEKVNRAFSGTAGILGGLGISIGALSTVRSAIGLDARLVRLGLTANLDAQKVNELKRAIFETAQLPDIKLDTGSIISALEVILEKTGDIGQASRENLENLARAVQAAGTDGAAMGDVFSEFAKNKFTAEEITKLMDDIITISDMGEYTFVNFANTAKSVLSSYSLIGNTPENVKNAVIAMQVLTAGTKSADVAATVLDSTMRELTDPKKRKALENLGINVRNNATGELRDFNDILLDVAEAYKNIYKADYINTIFGSETQKAIRAYGSEFAKTIPQMKDLGDTTGTLAGKAAVMSETLKANLQNLQTVFYNFADKNLTGPLQDLTELLNKLAENPEKVEAAIRGIAIGIGTLAAVKIGAGIISFVASLNSLKSGSGLNMSGLANAAGGAGIPVHVTNWGGQAGSSMMPGAGIGGPVPGTGSAGSPAQPALLNNRSPLESARSAVGNISGKQYARGAAGAGITAAIFEIPQMVGELQAIAQDETLTNRERGEAKGGAIGDATGSIIGAAAGGAAGIAAGAAVGAAVGSVVPVLGTAVGALVGAGVGAIGMWLGGRTGRAVGAAIGGAVAGDDEALAKKAEREAFSPSPGIAPAHAPALSGLGIYTEGTYSTASPGLPDFSYNTANTTTTGPGRTYWVNDLIVTPQGRYSTHPDDYIIAMKNPAALVNNDMRSEVRTVERVSRAMPPAPVIVEGEIELHSDLVIDDKGYRLRQSTGKNTTPYKFAVGSAKNARLIQ
jgi:hypothetical protein